MLFCLQYMTDGVLLRETLKDANLYYYRCGIQKKCMLIQLFFKRLRRLGVSPSRSGVIPTNLSGCSNLELLYLNLNELTGSIPKGMSLLPKLTTLLINDNKLTGGIPPFMGNITSMEMFSANMNPLGGSIPDTLGLWKSLTAFYSGGCNLYGSIPHSIFNLSLLVNLTLADNHLTGSLPSEIGSQLPNLELLQLWGNELTGVLPPSISNCSKLVYLELTDNSFSGKLTIDFSKLRDINIILLNDNNFHGRGEADDMRFINYLRNCTKLVDLELGNCNLIGMLPISIGNLSDQLDSLYLSENQLFGRLPSSIGSLVGLTTLVLADNRFKGKIPTTIGKLQKLQVLYLNSNHFSGPIPDVIGNLSLLTKLYLYSNKLEGHIPPSLGNCKELNYLDLSYNRLYGKIPKQLLQIPALTILLNLSHNNLHGSVPSEVKDLNMLNILDLSYNNLSGNISILGECIGLSTLNLRGNIFQGIIPLSLSSLRGCSFTSSKSRSPQKFYRGAHKSFLAECEAWRNIRHRNLLKIITSCSSVDFQRNDFKALVYEFMPNGSINDWLHSSANTSKLNLLERINILRDVATALDYLHNRCQTTIVHGDLKPSNILLDDDMVAHVGDFGLTRLLGTDLNQNSSTGVKGTIGYAPPEYGIGSEMTSSGDVYSFGILLLEVMTGKKPTDSMFNEGLSLHKFAYMALPDHVVDVIDNDAIVLQSTEANAKKVEECLIATIKIGVSCSLDSPPQRMKIEIVVIELQRILDVLQNI
ncbi:kinase-like domain-containing protein [Tanacetum coccineum]